MSTPLSLTSNFFFCIFALTLIYFTNKLPPKPAKYESPKQTNLTLYVHGYFTAYDTSSELQVGPVAVIDDTVTEGPNIGSKEIGKAQGVYVKNSEVDGKAALYMIFSIIFGDGKFKGSSLEIQGLDVSTLKQRELGVVSGTGYFRFVKGYVTVETQFLDIPDVRGVIKLNVNVKHY